MKYDRQIQIGALQSQLQAENRVFDITIIALERLEEMLNREKNAQKLVQTAKDTERDLHDGTQSLPTRDRCFRELCLHCENLHITSYYDDKEVFNIAAEAFINDLLAWYAGREFLDFYDEVDTCIIPILAALTQNYNVLKTKSGDLCNSAFDIFQNYIYESPITERSSERGYEETKAGVEAWILGQHYASIPMESYEGYTTTHIRGDVLDGYKRIITALTIMFQTSEPAKFFYQVIKNYIPDIPAQFPDINEEEIDKLYERKKEGFEPEMPNEIAQMNADIYPLLDKAVKDVLEKHNVDFSEINITINIAIKK